MAPVAASPPAATSSTPTSSSTWLGGSSIWTSATTPQTGTIGCQARVGSISSGVQGPAATRTEPAGRRTPAASTPRARPEITHGQAVSPSWKRTPAAKARRANARVAAIGLTG
jgi:hypothetical protein